MTVAGLGGSPGWTRYEGKEYRDRNEREVEGVSFVAIKIYFVVIGTGKKNGIRHVLSLVDDVASMARFYRGETRRQEDATFRPDDKEPRNKAFDALNHWSALARATRIRERKNVQTRRALTATD